MRALIVLAAMLSASLAFATPIHSVVGTGVEARFQNNVNPDYSDAHGYTQIYLKAVRRPWSIVIEATPFEKHESSSGSYSVSTETFGAGLWGRYDFLATDRLAPFVALGTGIYLDKISTEFQGTSDFRSGRRGLLGLGTGLSATFWQTLLLEGEIRGLSVEDQKDPMLTVVLRAGVQI